jgi:hypothetical protein
VFCRLETKFVYSKLLYTNLVELLVIGMEKVWGRNLDRKAAKP